MDCDATTHNFKDESKFINFDNDLDASRHIAELVDGSRYNNLALKRGAACIEMTDWNGKFHRNILKDVLYMPSFNNNNIFSVQVRTENCDNAEFKANSGILNAE